ncbi:hypothetical protein LQL77_18995 [Rhodococcus cerastii]|nr:hypothetical protein [Rhodococcus cerastii]
MKLPSESGGGLGGIVEVAARDGVVECLGFAGDVEALLDHGVGFRWTATGKSGDGVLGFELDPCGSVPCMC